MIINSITKGKNLIGNKSLVYFTMIATDLLQNSPKKQININLIVLYGF